MIAFLASAVVLLASLISKLASENEGGWIFYFFAFAAMIFSGFFLLFVWLVNGILKLAMLFVGRKQEYRADQVVVKAGFGAGLLFFSEKLKNLEWPSNKNLLSKLYAAHPPVMLRIGEVEKLTHQLA